MKSTTAFLSLTILIAGCTKKSVDFQGEYKTLYSVHVQSGSPDIFESLERNSYEKEDDIKQYYDLAEISLILRKEANESYIGKISIIRMKPGIVNGNTIKDKVSYDVISMGSDNDTLEIQIHKNPNTVKVVKTKGETLIGLSRDFIANNEFSEMNPLFSSRSSNTVFYSILSDSFSKDNVKKEFYGTQIDILESRFKDLKDSTKTKYLRNAIFELQHRMK